MLCQQGICQNSHGDGKILWQHQGHWKWTCVYMVLTECFSRRILRLRTSALDVIHPERVSTSTFSFFAHRLAYSSHASMIMSNVLVSCLWDRFPVFWAVAQKISQFYITYYIEITCHYKATWSVQKLWIRAVARWGILGLRRWKSSCCNVAL